MEKENMYVWVGAESTGEVVEVTVEVMEGWGDVDEWVEGEVWKEVGIVETSGTREVLHEWEDEEKVKVHGGELQIFENKGKIGADDETQMKAY